MPELKNTDLPCLLMTRDQGISLQGMYYHLTLKAPITATADDIHKYFFIVLQRK